jgi:hypothetical protein
MFDRLVCTASVRRFCRRSSLCLSLRPNTCDETLHGFRIIPVVTCAVCLARDIISLVVDGLATRLRLMLRPRIWMSLVRKYSYIPAAPLPDALLGTSELTTRDRRLSCTRALS